MKKLQYLVRINKDPESDWGASVPDLPGCVATGKTIDLALWRIQDDIALHLRGLRDDGIKVPQPRHRSVTPRRTERMVDFTRPSRWRSNKRAALDHGHDTTLENQGSILVVANERQVNICYALTLAKKIGILDKKRSEKR